MLPRKLSQAISASSFCLWVVVGFFLMLFSRLLFPLDFLNRKFRKSSWSFPAQITRLVNWGGLECFHISYEVEPIGEALQHPSMVMYSHGSNIDPLLVASSCPIPLRFVAKSQLIWFPFIGWTIWLSGGVFVNRSKHQESIDKLNKQAEAMGKGVESWSIAPEGTRRRKGSSGRDSLQAFKKGGFHMAKIAKVPITPVVIYGAYELWPRDKALPDPGTVTIRYLPQIPYNEEETVDELCLKVRNAMEEALDNPPSRDGLHSHKRHHWLPYAMSALYVALIAWAVALIRG